MTWAKNNHRLNDNFIAWAKIIRGDRFLYTSFTFEWKSLAWEKNAKNKNLVKSSIIDNLVNISRLNYRIKQIHQSLA